MTKKHSGERKSHGIPSGMKPKDLCGIPWTLAFALRADGGGELRKHGNLIGNGKANKRSVWTVNTQSFTDAHFATFPEKLIEPCILAGCSAEGLVLDPFMGAGTTALVARKLNRNFIGIELNQKYIEIAERRLQREVPLFI